MPRNHSSPSQNFFLLNLAGYLTLATIIVSSWYDITQSAHTGVILALLLMFGVLLAVYQRTENSPQWIHLYLGGQSGLILGVALVEPQISIAFILFFVLSAQAMLFLPLKSALIWLGLFFLVTFTLHARECACFAFSSLPYAGGYTFFGAFGGALRLATEARRRSDALLAELQEAHRQLQQVTEQAQQLAAAEERNRLAREMHDSLGHRLTVAVVQLEGAQRLIPTNPERAGQMIGTMREQLKEALAELRRTVSTLRAPVDPEAIPADLTNALVQMVKNFGVATGLSVDLQVEGGPPALTAEQRLALYRTAQEGLTNVQRHAAAHKVWLRLVTTATTVALSVQDDGQGLSAAIPDGRFGLLGLRERAEQLGGSLTLSTPREGGTLVLLELPLREVNSKQ